MKLRAFRRPLCVAVFVLLEAIFIEHFLLWGLKKLDHIYGVDGMLCCSSTPLLDQNLVSCAASTGSEFAFLMHRHGDFGTRVESHLSCAISTESAHRVEVESQIINETLFNTRLHLQNNSYKHEHPYKYEHPFTHVHMHKHMSALFNMIAVLRDTDRCEGF